MIDRLLRNHLEPLALASRKWLWWRALAVCWAGAALAALGLKMVCRAAGWPMAWILPSVIAAALVAAGFALYRFRRTPPDYLALARQIEAENPQLHALLLTAVEQQPGSPGGELNYLQRRVVTEAMEQYRRSSWGESIVRRLFLARCAHWLAFSALVIVLFTLRTSLPNPGELWTGAESSGGVSVTPGDATVERGSGLVILARFDGKLPAEAALVLKPVNEAERRLPLMKNLADPVFGGGIPEVKGDLTYRVEFSTGRTRDFKVSVFDYPKLDHADAKIAYPAYTKMPEKTIPDTRRVSAVEGSTVAYSFFLNKPVVSARLVAKDQPAVPLVRDTNNATIYHAGFTLDQNRRYELQLVDDAGRTNKLPPEFVLNATQNRTPEVKLTSPRGDQRVSALEEIQFQAEVSDDFGLRGYGIAYSLGGGETKTIELGHESGPNEKRQLNYLLSLENLGAQPDQFLSYYVWADDVGPDGNVRRTSGDMFFAEVRPFDEIYREGQSPDAGQQSNNNNNNGQQANQTEKLADLQKQVISATWNLQRRETGAKPTAKFKDDVGVVRDSQNDALGQARALADKIDDPRMKGFAEEAAKAMEKAASGLGDAADKNTVKPLSPALSSEQSAYQELLRLSAREYSVTRNNSRSRNARSGGQRNQAQLDQLDLKQSENRYETEREAAAAQTPEQREQLQVTSRLKELAQRQQDLNNKLRELQTALQEAKTDAEREDIQQRLKRLREDQQDLLADVDELRQRMDRPENQSRMSEERQQLDQTRSEVQNAAESLKREAVPQALASGTRAQRELQQLQEDFRKKNSSQFSDQMRQMRDTARQLAQDQEQIAKKLGELSDPNQKTLSDSDERKGLANQLEQQKNALTNLFTSMRDVSEKSETAEPLLSKQLYDMVRQTDQDDVDKSLDMSSELVQRGFLPQAGPFEQRAHQNIDKLKQGVERAAESVLGDDTEALRLARRELDELTRQLDQEVAQSANAPGTNAAGTERGLAAGHGTGTNGTERASAQAGRRGEQANASETQSEQNGNDPSQAGSQQPGERGQAGQRDQAGQPGQAGQRGQSDDQRGQGGQSGQAGNRGANGANGEQQQEQTSSGQPGQDAQGAPDAQDAQAGGGRNGQRDTARTGAREIAGGNAGYGGGASYGPLVGENYVDWSDRLRNVEEMVDIPDLRTQVARIRDRARAVRLDYKKNGKRPDWDVVRLQIVEPLAEVRARMGEELARRESKDALVPLDRDPVPAQFSERVRHYYEELGKSE